MRASYPRAVEWIAYNDDVELGDNETGWIVSICLVADLFQGGDQTKVATDVMKFRRKNVVGYQS
jgi:hypothetical protein